MLCYRIYRIEDSVLGIILCPQEYNCEDMMKEVEGASKVRSPI